jgi:hypothetical protein
MISARPCPAAINIPASHPCSRLSLIVTANIGPGIRAPDIAIRNDDAKIKARFNNTPSS